MNNPLDILSYEERISLLLRSMYQSAGYRQYKMSKFEEYDLYVANKDFLLSENVITFTDTDGKLLALKPDVTLSIIKNSKDEPDSQMKVYYNESVYRVAKGTRFFKEFTQVGLECLGKVDRELTLEVLALASKSLSLISEECVLEISDLDIVSSVLDASGVSLDERIDFLSALGEKNLGRIREIIKNNEICEPFASRLLRLSTLYGDIKDVASELEFFALDADTAGKVEDFKALLSSLDAAGLSSRVVVDFSVVNNMNYYSGISFKGFVNGIPTGVLGGGRYDKLMRKMNKRSSAIGFAVYLDELSRLSEV